MTCNDREHEYSYLWYYDKPVIDFIKLIFRYVSDDADKYIECLSVDNNVFSNKDFMLLFDNGDGSKTKISFGFVDNNIFSITNPKTENVCRLALDEIIKTVTYVCKHFDEQLKIKVMKEEKPKIEFVY